MKIASTTNVANEVTPQAVHFIFLSNLLNILIQIVVVSMLVILIVVLAALGASRAFGDGMTNTLASYEMANNLSARNDLETTDGITKGDNFEMINMLTIGDNLENTNGLAMGDNFDHADHMIKGLTVMDNFVQGKPQRITNRLASVKILQCEGVDT